MATFPPADPASYFVVVEQMPTSVASRPTQSISSGISPSSSPPPPPSQPQWGAAAEAEIGVCSAENPAEETFNCFNQRPHWGEASERWDGVQIAFSERVGTILNRTESKTQGCIKGSVF